MLEISIRLVGKLLDRLGGERSLRGAKQQGEGNYDPHRSPEDNGVPGDPLADIVPHLRACEPQHPAFFNWRGVKYVISLRPEPYAGFPDDLEITFFDGVEAAQ